MVEQTTLKDRKYNSFRRVFTLGEFVREYVEGAIDLARGNPCLDDYDQILRDRIATRFSLSVEEMRDIEKPFYWFLFSDVNGSPISYQQAQRSGESGHVRIRQISPDSIDKAVEHILEKSGEILDCRIRKVLVTSANADIV